MLRTCEDRVGAGEMDEGFPVKFIVRWTIHEGYAEAKVFEASYSGDVSLDRPKPPPVLDPLGDDDLPFMEADFRWDGCGHWNTAPGGMRHHTCGTNDVAALAELIVFMHKRAHELIPLSEGGD